MVKSTQNESHTIQPSERGYSLPKSSLLDFHELGWCMNYSELQVASPLSPYVQLIWALESESGEDTYPRSIILPDGVVEVVFHYGEPFYTWQGGAQFVQPQSFAISMMRKYVEIGSRGWSGFIAIRFFPWGAYHFFDVAIRQFLDQTIEATHLWGSESDMLTGQLKEQSSLDGRFRLMEEFLLWQLSRHQKDDQKADDAIRLIRQTKGTLSIEEICTQMELSGKQLERKFLATVGVTPKVFSRITRFLNVCHHIDEFKDKSLTQLAYDCGFYDQAHFIKEFRQFSGYTPGEFFEKKRVFYSDL